MALHLLGVGGTQQDESCQDVLGYLEGAGNRFSKKPLQGHPLMVSSMSGMIKDIPTTQRQSLNDV